jgi:hypothetical protein
VSTTGSSGLIWPCRSFHAPIDKQAGSAVRAWRDVDRAGAAHAAMHKSTLREQHLYIAIAPYQ